jgi:diadenosine tetraphosphate (Ap4A) HIT family hydrolase
MSGRTVCRWSENTRLIWRAQIGYFSSAVRTASLKSNSTHQNCPLCRAANNTSVFENGVNVNTILGSRGRFLIVPALGPLVVGHVLVISAIHTEGLRYLPAEMQQRYELLSGEIRAYCARFGDSVLEAEHGTSEGSIRGPCIRHTHIHILPGLGDVANVFDDRRDLAVVNSIMSTYLGPYIWIRNNVGERVYDASRAIGQEIRRTIGGNLAVDDWDWVVNPKPELIVRTKEYWRGLSKCLG